MFAIVRVGRQRWLPCLRREGGQGMIEYAAIVALISVAALAVIVLVGPETTHVYRAVERSLCTPVNVTFHWRRHRCH